MSLPSLDRGRIDAGAGDEQQMFGTDDRKPTTRRVDHEKVDHCVGFGGRIVPHFFRCSSANRQLVHYHRPECPERGDQVDAHP
jgi:hypothetical protein